MRRIEVVIPENKVLALSDGLKKLAVGGITISKVKGRGKTVAPQIHASKGTEIFTPEFSDKYILDVIVPDSKENKVIEIVRANCDSGKIFISPVMRAVDILTGAENEMAI
jgi:nitrogen regulatory protein P-II 1